ncbi:TetR/AcrR family transcriptional regulator [Gordonia sp. FQ]|uniref:TetR/AcrR family transcriptional regulator n=1 Tax=Gordonia sp. FQ TaxID=3446634 RepID=UPI003F87FFF1
MSSETPRSRTSAGDVRPLLVAAGRRILERDGAAGLTVRAVAKEAGVAPMGVYNHFDGKEGLLDAVVTDGFAEFGAAIATTDAEAAARLVASGVAYRDFALANPVLYSLMFSTTCEAEGRTVARAFDNLVDIVRYAQVGGVIRAGDPVEIAVQVWSCAHGAVSLELAGAEPALSRAGAESGAEAFADHGAKNYENVLALIVRGLAP